MAVKPTFYDRVRWDVMHDAPLNVFGMKTSVKPHDYVNSDGLRMKDMIRQAVPFVIDDTALMTCLHMREQLMRSQRVHLPDVARVPFEYTWLEYDPRLKVPNYEPYLTSQKVGHLIVRTTSGATTLTFEQVPKGQDDGFVMLPMTFNWTTEPHFTAPWRLIIGGVSEYTEIIPDDKADAIRAALLSGATLIPTWIRRCGGDLYQSTGGHRFEETVTDMLEQGRSCQSLLMSLLALVAWCPTEKIKGKPDGRWLHKGRTRPYMEHTTVKIRVPIRTAYQYIDKAGREARKRRRHRVREHIRVLNRGKPDMKIVIVPEHMRGDAGLGFVDQNYEVT